jgi:hypothetical protein
MQTLIPNNKTNRSLLRQAIADQFEKQQMQMDKQG